MSAGAILGGASIGAGVGVSSVALAPFNAANTFMGSAFFGYGMILGERYAYQEDWPKIQARLVNGEKIENIIQEYTGTFTAVVMKEAKIIFETVTREFIAIMKAALAGTIPTPVQIPENAPTIGDPRRPESTAPKPPPVEQTPIFTPGGVPVEVPKPPTVGYLLKSGKTTSFIAAINRLIALLTFNAFRVRTKTNLEKWRVDEVNFYTARYPDMVAKAFPFVSYTWKIGEPYPTYKS